MRVFVTGASGFIGSAVVPELLGAGHQVTGLARSDASAEALAAAGAEVHRGDLDDLDSLRKGADASDGVIHLAYNHDFTDMAAAARNDLRVVEAIGEVLLRTDKPFVITSGTLALAFGRPASEPVSLGTEADVLDPALARVASEHATIALAERGVRSSVIRLSPTVHGEGDGGFVPRLIDIAREKGSSAYVGDGATRWPAVDRLDAAVLYRLAVEAAPAGSRLHGVGDEGVPFRDIAGVIGRHLDLPVVSITQEEADAHFGFLGRLVSADNPTSSALTRELLGWQPTHPGLIDDLEHGHYFDN
jgi:nucleoside-diphosphate-sugar epimerase